MAETSKIEWTDATWNPWYGCHKVSQGCKHCYMFREQKRYGRDPNTVQRSKTRFNDPLTWTEPRRVFTCSWSDWFIEEADAWRDEAWDIIRRTPHLTYQILTKRPENIAGRMPPYDLPNVWLGVSVENQQAANERIDYLLRASAAVRFLSCEPLLGPLDLEYALYQRYGCNGSAPDPECVECGWQANTVDWVIVGGESGPDCRPMDIAWAQNLRRQCEASGVAFFMKQLGGHPNKRHELDDLPEDLRVREYPERTKAK